MISTTSPLLGSVKLYSTHRAPCAKTPVTTEGLACVGLHGSTEVVLCATFEIKLALLGVNGSTRRSFREGEPNCAFRVFQKEMHKSRVAKYQEPKEKRRKRERELKSSTARSD